MERAIIVRGRLSGPRRVDLDEAIEEVTGEVEVVLRPVARPGVPARTPPQRDILDVLRSLPAGTRTKEDIDRQLAEEKAEWSNP